jgi:hypothetical protein
LSAKDVEAMAKREPGSPARYLEERRKELAELEEKQRQEDDKRRFTEAFVAASGSKNDAETAWKTHRNEQAATAAQRVDQAAAQRTRQHTTSRLQERRDHDQHPCFGPAPGAGRAADDRAA